MQTWNVFILMLGQVWAEPGIGGQHTEHTTTRRPAWPSNPCPLCCRGRWGLWFEAMDDETIPKNTTGWQQAKLQLQALSCTSLCWECFWNLGKQILSFSSSDCTGAFQGCNNYKGSMCSSQLPKNWIPHPLHLHTSQSGGSGGHRNRSTYRAWREEPECTRPIAASSDRNASLLAKQVREEYCSYFNTNGAVSWQENALSWILILPPHFHNLYPSVTLIQYAGYKKTIINEMQQIHLVCFYFQCSHPGECKI